MFRNQHGSRSDSSIYSLGVVNAEHPHPCIQFQPREIHSRIQSNNSEGVKCETLP